MRKNVYIIVGEGKCGKSSLVRALTGVYQSARMNVRLANGNDLDFRIWSKSCQEANESPDETLNYINSEEALNVIVTLRFEPAPHMIQFNAIDYFNIISQNHTIAGVVFMSPDLNVRQFNTNPAAVIIPNCKSRPINANAAMVKNGWGLL